jgi:predicted RNase H-like HicB family nuclease
MGTMLDYLTIAYRHPTGGWVAVVPDFVGVTGRGSELSTAIQEARAGAQAVLDVLITLRAASPKQTDLKFAQFNPLLLKRYGVDWPNAFISFVALSSNNAAAICPTISTVPVSGMPARTPVANARSIAHNTATNAPAGRQFSRMRRGEPLRRGAT